MSAGPSTRRRSTRLSTRQPSPVSSPINDAPSSVLSSPHTPSGASIDGSESDNDDDGVFLGAHDPVELQLLAKLSLQSQSTPSSSTPSGSRRLSRIIRVKKRDSREFLRRKTLSLLQVENDEEGDRETGQKANASPRKLSMTPRSPANRLDSTQEEASSPLPADVRSPLQQLPIMEESPTRTAHSGRTIDLATTLSHLQLDACGSPRRSDVHNEEDSDEASTDVEEDEEEDESEEGDYSSDSSDKENAPPPSPTSPGPTSLNKSFETDKAVFAIGLDDKAVIDVLTGSPEDDAPIQFDMGGANPSDFSDPEDGSDVLRSPTKLSDDGLPSSPPMLGIGFKEVEQGDETGHSEVRDAEAKKQAYTSIATVVHDDGEQDKSGAWEGLENPDTSGLKGPDNSCPPSPNPNTVAAGLEHSLEELTIAESGNGAINSDTTTSVNSSAPIAIDDLESPLPSNRGGPVIIPKIASHLGSIRAESGSPFRPLPAYDSPPLTSTQPDLGLYYEDGNETLQLHVPQSPLASPTNGVPVTPQQLLPLPALPVSTISCQTATPSSCKLAYPAHLGMGAARTTGLLKASHPILKPNSASHARDQKQRIASESAARDSKTVARALAVRSQLDAAFCSTSKLSRFGPPQRTASGSSASSTSAPSRKQVAPARPPVPSTAITTAKSVQNLKAAGPAASSSSSPKVRPAASLATATMPKPAPGTNSIPSTKPILAAPAAKPQVPSSKPIQALTAPSRSALSSRPALKGGKPIIRAAVGGSTFNKPKIVPLSARVPISSINQQTKEGSPSLMSTNPLKRPVPGSQVAVGRPLITAGAENTAPRPMLGLPSRISRENAGLSTGGVFGEFSAIGGPPLRIIGGGLHKSPVRPAGYQRLVVDTPLSARKLNLANPSRVLGTPSRLKAPVEAQPFSARFSGPIAAVLAEAGNRGEDSSESSRAKSSEDAKTSDLQRGSSEDHEEVSFALPNTRSSETPTSPTSTDAGRTPRVGDKVLRTRYDASPETASTVKGKRLQPPSVMAPGARSRQTAPASATIAPNMSQKELNATTQLNTMRNQVYLVAIDRQIVRKNIPRPPSPTSKIRTTADREEAEKKAGRGARAKRRAKGSEDLEDEEEDDAPAIERVEQARMQGDDEDWITPARPVKRAKLGHVEGHCKVDKSVRWDKGLVIIRDDGTRAPLSRATSESELPRGALRQDNVPLDAQGNLVETDRPKEALKRTKVTVTAVFYEGEEPVPGIPIYNRPEALGTAPISLPGSSKGKKK